MNASLPPLPPLPLLHQAWRRLPVRPRRAARAWLMATLAPRPDRAVGPCAPGLAVAGELERASGLGEGARLMLRALAELALPGRALTLGDRHAPAPPAAMPLVVHANAPQMAAALLGLPRATLRGRRVIGYWAWDLPVAPASWRAGAQFVHEVWVPSRFCQAALDPLLPGRVRVVGHPLASAPPQPAHLGRADFGLPADAVVVLASFSLASSFARKNPLGMIAAFIAAFGARRDRLLLLKVGDPHHFAADFALLRAAVADHANIRIMTETLPGADRHALTACADIVLSLHRSEGFGLVPAEAMLLGRPVIATGWSGPMDYMTPQSAALVGYRLIPAVDPRQVFSAEGAVWADPDQAEAVAALRRLADDAAWRAALGARGRDQARLALGSAALRSAVAGLGGHAMPAA